jgi:hypothetical protein
MSLGGDEGAFMPQLKAIQLKNLKHAHGPATLVPAQIEKLLGGWCFSFLDDFY